MKSTVYIDAQKKVFPNASLMVTVANGKDCIVHAVRNLLYIYCRKLSVCQHIELFLPGTKQLLFRMVCSFHQKSHSEQVEDPAEQESAQCQHVVDSENSATEVEMVGTKESGRSSPV
jgi:hypothetical protein